MNISYHRPTDLRIKMKRNSNELPEIKFPKKKLTREEKKLTERDFIDLENDAQMEAFAKVWWNSAKNYNHWINIANEVAEFDENAQKVFYYSLIENGMINKKIRRKQFNEMFEILLYEYLSIWAVQQREKDTTVLIKGSTANFVLNEINKTGQATQTKLKQIFFRNGDLTSKQVSDSRLMKTLLNMEKRGYIIYVEQKTFEYYKLSKHIEKIGDKFYYRKEI